MVSANTRPAIEIHDNHTSKLSPLLPTYSDVDVNIDISSFSDPYTTLPPQRLPSTPPLALSLAGTSCPSTQSSAYTNSNIAADSNASSHIYVDSSAASETVGEAGILSRNVIQLREDGTHRSSPSPTLMEQPRWSGYSARSWVSSIHAGSSSDPSATSSYETDWKPVSSRDGPGSISGGPFEGSSDYEGNGNGSEPTSVAMLAEQGSGRIFRTGGIPIVPLAVDPSTTHLLLGSSSSPNSVPSFLAASLPQICNTLLALDISANFLVALPPALASCRYLKQINVSSNPLRVLPDFLNKLYSLRVLIADSTGITTLPGSLCDLVSLHTLSVRRNKMHSLPSWLCLLPSLQAVYLDGNPFRGPWEALVEPLLRKTTIATSLSSTSICGSTSQLHGKSSSFRPVSDSDEIGSGTWASHETAMTISSDTVPSRRHHISNYSTDSSTSNRRLVRTRTTPNRAYYSSMQPTKVVQGCASADGELRKMKSTGELRSSVDELSGGRPHTGITSYSYGSNSFSAASLRPRLERPAVPKRFASLGVYSDLGDGPRPTLPNFSSDYSGDDNIDECVPHPYNESGVDQNYPSSDASVSDPSPSISSNEGQETQVDRQGKEGGKTTRWGFLKKISMGKIKAHSEALDPFPVTPRTEDHVLPQKISPKIEVRFSTTGSLGPLTNAVSPATFSPIVPPNPTPQLGEEGFDIACPFLPVKSPRVSDVNTISFLQVDGSTETLPAVCLKAESMLGAYRSGEESDGTVYTRAFRSVVAYLRDMYDLGATQNGDFSSTGTSSDQAMCHDTLSRHSSATNRAEMESMSATYDSSPQTMSIASIDSGTSLEERKYNDNKSKRCSVVREIIETERTYVRGLQELVDIYIKPSTAPANLISGVGSNKETTIPSVERKIVFSGVEALFSFHKGSFLPALENAAAPIMQLEASHGLDFDGQLSIHVARAVSGIFLKHAAFMKMYSTYINNCDNSAQRVRYWTLDRLATAMPVVTAPAQGTMSDSSSSSCVYLTAGQRRRIKAFLKRCRMNPRHSQLNLEGYLLLPVQRIPRYRLLLEELLRSTPPVYAPMDDSLDKAVAEISALANSMNEGKRESESRRKLVQWQARIRGKFPSPLVQPHRRLIMDGPLRLTRVVRKTVASFENINAQGDASMIQVECLAPELTPRSLLGILCNDLLVLCRDSSDGRDPLSLVDLWAVLRMQTLPQPASIVHGNTLRLVDNKAILYFDVASPSDALNWYRAINLHIPASKV